MAGINVTSVQDLLGKTVVFTENVHGFSFERRGSVVAVVAYAPGVRCGGEFLLDEFGADLQYYAISDVTFHSVL